MYKKKTNKQLEYDIIIIYNNYKIILLHVHNFSAN